MFNLASVCLTALTCRLFHCRYKYSWDTFLLHLFFSFSAKMENKANFSLLSASNNSLIYEYVMVWCMKTLLSNNLIVSSFDNQATLNDHVLCYWSRRGKVLYSLHIEYCLQMQAVDAKVLTGSIQKATIIQSSLSHKAQGEIYTLQ